jgi:hypothetical protein
MSDRPDGSFHQPPDGSGHDAGSADRVEGGCQLGAAAPEGNKCPSLPTAALPFGYGARVAGGAS